VKPPTYAGTVLREHLGLQLLDSEQVKLLGVRARPLELYFLVALPLSRYGPVLTDLADCTFVRRAFQAVGKDHWPGLGMYSQQVYRGLLAVAVAVPLSVLLWLVHSRERRKRSWPYLTHRGVRRSSCLAVSTLRGRVLTLWQRASPAPRRTP
jgi:hypothetical protein